MHLKANESFGTQYGSLAGESIQVDQTLNPEIGKASSTTEIEFATSLENSLGEIPEDLNVTEELISKLKDTKK